MGKEKKGAKYEARLKMEKEKAASDRRAIKAGEALRRGEVPRGRKLTDDEVIAGYFGPSGHEKKN